jgi:hypothetical protein
MSKLAILSAMLFTSIAATAAVEPWPLQNGPGGAPPPPTPAEIAAAQAAQQAQMAAYQDYLQQQQQAAQQAMSTGNNELANSFGNMMPGGANGMGTQSVTTPNGNGISDGGSAGTGPNGMANRYVNGCSKDIGKFQFKFGTVKNGVGPDGCDPKLQMSDDLFDFMSKNLNRCVQESITYATSDRQPVQGGKIYHAGFMGDASHQMTGSLHNYGLAMDLNAIQVNGRMYNYSNKRDMTGQKFFTKFRHCWTDAVQKERAGCLAQVRSGMPGTIGEEDHRHHDHLHLSLPFCKQNKPSNAYITMKWLMNVAEAAEPAKKTAEDEGPMPPPSTFTHKTIKVKSGELKMTVENGHGEPVGADHTITLALTCENKTSPATAPIVVEACDFTDMSYNRKKNEVTLKFRTADIVSGKVSCRISNTKIYKLPCK